MSAALPPHCATADEPIPVYRDCPWAGPDMNTVTSIETMLAELAHVADDDVELVARFIVFIREIGCSVMAHYRPDGELGLNIGYPCDGQERQRNRWTFFLVGRLNAVDGRRDLLLRTLIDLGQVWDERRPGPREVSAAVRGYLSTGGRIMIDPEGKLVEGGGLSQEILRSNELFAAAQRASQTYFAMRDRPRAGRLIRRAVRMIGRPTDNGWIVLRSAVA